MASLNQISESIAISFDQQNNEVFKDNVKFRVKQICALLIEREMKQEGYGNMMYIQKYEAELEKVDATDSCLSSVLNSDCIILKTKNKIPTPVKTKGIPFIFVGNPTKDIIFTYGKKEHLKFFKYLKFAGSAYYYEYVDGYIYLYNATKIKTIKIEAKYSETIVDYCNKDNECFTDDMEFPCSSSIIAQAIDIIVKGGLQAIVNDYNVEINQEDGVQQTGR